MARLKKICAALALAGVGSTAAAAPVVAAIAVVAANAAAAAAIITATTAMMIGAGVMLASGLYQRQKAKKAERRARDAYNASLQDRTATLAQADAEKRYVYGRATVGGSVVAAFTRGDKDQFKDLVIVWAAHACEAVEDLLIAGESVQLDVSGEAQLAKYRKEEVKTDTHALAFDAAGLLTLPVGAQLNGISKGSGDAALQLAEDQYTVSGTAVQLAPAAISGWASQSVNVLLSVSAGAAQLWARHHLGHPTQTADARLIEDTQGLDGAWTSTDMLRGLCYSIITLDLNNADFQSGLPQFSARVRGMKVLDPRSGTAAWSANPALCAYDFLRSAEYGKGVLPEQVDGVIAAANACDELVPVPGGSGTAKRYTCNGAWTSGTNPDDVLEDLCNSMAGYVVPGGVWRLQAGVYTSPVLVLGDQHAAGAISMVPAPGQMEAWNGVKGQYIDPGQYNQVVDFEPLQIAQYVDDDGGEVWGSMAFPFTDEGWRARTIAAIALEKSRGKHLVWRGTLACLRARVGDRVQVTNALLGLSLQTFRVTKRIYAHDSAAIEMHLEQDKPEFYPLAANSMAVTPGVQPDTTYRVTPPSGLALTNPKPGVILVSVEPSLDLRVQDGGQLLIQARLAEGGDWVSMPSAPGRATSQELQVLQKGVYAVQVDWQAANGQSSGKWLAGVVTVAETAYATSADIAAATQSLAYADNPVFSGVVGFPVYAKAALPVVDGDNARKVIVVSDAAPGPAACISNGTHWISQVTGEPVE